MLAKRCEEVVVGVLLVLDHAVDHGAVDVELGVFLPIVT